MSDDPKLPVQVQALLNRLQARLGSGVAEVAASLLAAAEAAPERATREWQLFWKEVELEAERLAQGQAAAGAATAATAAAGHSGSPGSPERRDPQECIDSLRARVAAISHSLDA